MNIGLYCYSYFLGQLKKIMVVAKTTENPAMYLFKNDARTPIFMLEGLSRFYETQHNKKRFGKLKDEFKKLEDIIGSIDYYNWLIEKTQNLANCPEAVKDYFNTKKNNEATTLNQILENDNWLGEERSVFDKIQKMLTSATWQSARKDSKGLEAFYKNAVQDVLAFYKNADHPFTKMEAEVHELRRDLRWLSIYPKSFQGAIQLIYSKPTNPATLPYLTEEIVKSPFNIMPLAGPNKRFLLLEKQYFLALSYMIDELGNIKDKGLLIFGLAEAIKEIENISEDEANQKAVTLLNEVPNYEAVLLSKASQVCEDYFSNKLLKKLIKGRSKKNKEA